jgi:glycosyltransferase involved in cell wall biosynthesis
MPLSRIPVTVVIPVKNEEANLDKCLKRLQRFAFIIVVDSLSTDATKEIALANGASIIDFKWDGRYPKKRNWLLIEHPPATSWVLFVDADEIVDDAFCDEVVKAIADDAVNGYWLNYTNYFQGSRLQYGVPQRKLALFRVGKGLYERVEEESWTSLDMEVHEHPIIEGAIGEIKSPIEHNDFRGIKKFLERHVAYAAWEARRVLALGEAATRESGRLTRRQRFKYKNLEAWWYPLFYFVYTYVIRLGVLDGSAGFQYAFFKTWYFFSIRALIRELRQSKSFKRTI